MQFYTESPFYCDGIEICGGGGLSFCIQHIRYLKAGKV